MDIAANETYEAGDTGLPDGRDAPTPQAKGVEVANPVDLARLVAGWVLLEAVNLGEINPAMARRWSERMDQIFTAAIRGAQVAWGTRGELQIRWPPQENDILKAVSEKQRQRELVASTAISEPFNEQR